eukprot:TRINITY_DN51769_c0_g2_i1.p1 TRINITY_DN51769_c0_g2~~TRINITY_DN51769_c0_g2_i1.p1  ORF type:complete len:557 (+),score=30.27 TRINITY_DN51769_c0_g2_i1:60-1730(+)
MNTTTLPPKYLWIDVSVALNCSTLKEVTHETKDWLFHTPTIRCGCGPWDNPPDTWFSRAFLPLFYLGIALAVVTLGILKPRNEFLRTLSEQGEQRDPKTAIGIGVAQPPKVRLWYIDYARILCIAATVTEHSGGMNYSGSNVLWTQQWVLPYLYTISGISFMFSSVPLWLYEAKLAVVLVVGVGLNLIADIISGRDWLGNPGNTVFQMAYVILLMFMSLLTSPLRRALIWRKANPWERAPRDVVVWTSVAGVIFAFAITFFTAGLPFIDLDNAPGILAGLKGSGAEGILTQGPLMLSMIGGLNFLCMLACTVGVHDWLPVVLLAAIYFPRSVIPYNRGGHPINADLFMFGMVVKLFPLHKHELVKSVIREYWVVWVAALLICSNPDVKGRCDLWPLNSMWERLRFYTIECWLVIILISGTLNTSDSLGLTMPLNLWALYAYCAHVAWARVLPVPYGALVTYASAPLFVVGIKYQLQKRKGKRKAASQGSASNPGREEESCDVESAVQVSNGTGPEGPVANGHNVIQGNEEGNVETSLTGGTGHPSASSQPDRQMTI